MPASFAVVLHNSMGSWRLSSRSRDKRSGDGRVGQAGLAGGLFVGVQRRARRHGHRRVGENASGSGF